MYIRINSKNDNYIENKIYFLNYEDTLIWKNQY